MLERGTPIIHASRFTSCSTVSVYTCEGGRGIHPASRNVLTSLKGWRRWGAVTVAFEQALALSGEEVVYVGLGALRVRAAFDGRYVVVYAGTRLVRYAECVHGQEARRAVGIYDGLDCAAS